MKKLIQLVTLGVLLFACAPQKESQQINIVVTTGIIKDAIQNIVPKEILVTAILGPNSDPHLAKASKSDLRTIQKADIIIKNGLHLEGKLADALEKFKSKKTVLTLSDGLPEARLLNSSGTHDPHLWFDVQLWSLGIHYLSEQLQKELPDHKVEIQTLTSEYLIKLAKTDEWVKHQFTQTNPKDRVLITAHDAFRYFGKAYNLEVIGIQGLSTLSQTSIKKRTELSQLIIDKNIRLIFPEASVRDNQVNALLEDCQSKGYKLNIGSTLYSDALGNLDTEAGTYIGMVRYNVQEIAKAFE
ncbi:zinc ABC transporter substrate-binding protein [Cyclobacteriaceae bacterium]|nr:zinc ABC transporter substrate-binding protein [Cyclobacteriaceae bacterium]